MEAADQAQECEIAYSNPKCPYVTQININTQAMRNVDRALQALLGEDGTGLNDGVIHQILIKLNKLEDHQKTLKNTNDTQEKKECAEQKAKLSGKDKALIVGSFLTAFSLVAVELIRAAFNIS